MRLSALYPVPEAQVHLIDSTAAIQNDPNHSLTPSATLFFVNRLTEHGTGHRACPPDAAIILKHSLPPNGARAPVKAAPAFSS